MHQRKYKSSLMAMAVVSALGISHQASAQLEEVIVTAQKKEETLIEAPVAVSVVSGQDINDLSMFQADELNKLVTGMDVRYEGDSNVGVGSTFRLWVPLDPGHIGEPGNSATELAPESRGVG